MKNALLLFSFFLMSLFALPALAADWSLASRADAQVFRSVITDGANIVVFGNKGSAFLSADNGKTWRVLTTNTSALLFDATIMTNGEWLATGENSTAISSVDSGKTWSQLHLGVLGNLYGVSSKNNYGYMVGAGGIFLIRNGTTNYWSTSTLEVTDDLFDVQDMGDGTGWVVGANGDVFHLSQSGYAYAKITLTTRETLRAVKFSDTKNGWIVGTQGTVLHTEDGGMTWNTVSISGVSTQTLNAIDVSNNRIVIAGDKILATSDDAGKTWSVKSFTDTFDVFYGSLVLADGSAFAVGTDYDVASLIYRSTIGVVSVQAPEQLPVTQPEPVSPYSLVKLACPLNAGVNDPCKAVYYYAADGKRHAFPNDKVYFSWFTDFSTVKEVSANFLSSLALGKNVTYRPGVKLVKFQTIPTVYAVAKGGVLRPIVSEAIAASLYGTTWNKQVDDISDVFYGNYTIGPVISSSADYDPVQARVLVGSISENL